MTIAYVEANLKHTGLLELIHYDPDTGIFTHRYDRPRKKSGLAGCKVGPYWAVHLCGRQGAKVYAHRLAWFYVTGSWPKFEVDHENGVKLDNRWENLRPATGSQNQWNKGLQSNNTSGYKGVIKYKDKWAAYVGFRGTQKCLGTFSSPELASLAYETAARSLHGEFYKEVRT